MSIISKINNINTKINYYWSRALIIFWVAIIPFFILASRNANPQEIQMVDLDKPDSNETIEYTNCPISSTSKDYRVHPFLTNTEIGKYDLLEDTNPSPLSAEQIPPINSPNYISTHLASKCITSESDVVLLQINDEVRIYPKIILSHHQVIQDNIDGENFIVTYSPYADSIRVFEINANDNFSFSGRLLNSSNILIDEKTNTFWSQVTGEGIIGDRTGEKLQLIPHTEMKFGDVLNNYPDALVLSFETGFNLDYSVDYYASYYEDNSLVGEINWVDDEVEKKDKVFMINSGSLVKSYSIELLESADVKDKLGQTEIRIYFDKNLNTYLVEDTKTKKNIAYTTMYYYAWKQIYPQEKITK